MSDRLHPLLAGFPVRLEIPVAFGDMDALGHVNNTRFFRWFEDVRFAAFIRAGLEEVRGRTGIGPILAHTRCAFRVPVTWPDTILAGVRVTAIDEDRFTMEHTLVSREKDAVAALGETRIVIVDYGSGRKVPIPTGVREALEELREPPLA